MPIPFNWPNQGGIMSTIGPENKMRPRGVALRVRPVRRHRRRHARQEVAR
jgi:hypothetical protein